MKTLKQILFPCMDALKKATDDRDRAIFDLRSAIREKNTEFHGMTSVGMSAIPVREVKR